MCLVALSVYLSACMCLLACPGVASQALACCRGHRTAALSCATEAHVVNTLHAALMS